MSQQQTKIVKTVTDAAVITGLFAGVGWVGCKILRVDFTRDPSSNDMNFAKMTAAVAGAIAFKGYPEDQKLLPPFRSSRIDCILRWPPPSRS